MNEIFCSTLKNRASKAGVELSEDMTRKFFAFYELLIETNKSFNLTAITEPDDVINKHFIDSLSSIPTIAELYDIDPEMFHVKHSEAHVEYRKEEVDPEQDEMFHVKPKETSSEDSDQKREADTNKMFHVKHGKSLKKVIDIGTGAGFPGIPLAIALPDVKFTLLDSLRKRTDFIKAACTELGITNVEVIHGRAEDLAHDESYREKYDICVSRAVANLSTLSEYCIPFINTGGYFIPYKSGDVEEELELSKPAIKKLGSKTRAVKQFLLPDTDITRSLIVIHKEYTVDKRYPRKAGVPERKPL